MVFTDGPDSNLAQALYYHLHQEEKGIGNKRSLLSNPHLIKHNGNETTLIVSLIDSLKTADLVREGPHINTRSKKEVSQEAGF